jgi:hypothetical protein
VVGNDIPRAGISRLTKPGALFAQRLTARSRAAVLGLDVVAGVALRVVVMHVRSDGVPGCDDGHRGFTSLRLKLLQGAALARAACLGGGTPPTVR